MTPSFLVRSATLADAPIIARHRAEMFRDMSTLPDALYDELVNASRSYLATAMPSGEYVGWVATPITEPETIVAGVGVQLRTTLPHPAPGGRALLFGPDALVVNVFTERGWRRRGAAKLLMQQLLDWAHQHRVDRLVLHASQEGRPLYEQLGFVATNEMRLTVGR